LEAEANGIMCNAMQRLLRSLQQQASMQCMQLDGDGEERLEKHRVAANVCSSSSSGQARYSFEAMRCRQLAAKAKVSLKQLSCARI
jgi:hypothetical protein